MSKKGVRVYVDQSEWERFKNDYNASEKIRDYIKHVNGTDTSKQERIEEINEEIKELKEKIANHQETIANLQSEKQTLQTEIKKEQKVEDQEKKFIKVCKRKMQENDWNQPSDIKNYWKEELDRDKESLWSMAKSSGLKPRQAKQA